MMLGEALRLSLLASIFVIPLVHSLPVEDFETVRTSNAAILNRLGLVPLVLGDGHHRKRLAESTRLYPSSRRHNPGSPHDSHVYVVKLPPSQPYYSSLKPLKQKLNATKANPNFRSNGKPAKIFHWNLPMVKKINEKKKHLALIKMDQARKKMEAERERLKVAEKMNYFKKLAQEQLVAEAQKKPTRNNDKWLSHPEHLDNRAKNNQNSENATQVKIISDKNYRLNDEPRSHLHQHRNNWQHNDVHRTNPASSDTARPKKHRKKSASVSYYYAPALTGKSASTSISKHFAGNGKPKAFYVMEKSRKPVYYHPLLP